MAVFSKPGVIRAETVPAVATDLKMSGKYPGADLYIKAGARQQILWTADDPLRDQPRNM